MITQLGLREKKKEREIVGRRRTEGGNDYLTLIVTCLVEAAIGLIAGRSRFLHATLQSRLVTSRRRCRLCRGKEMRKRTRTATIINSRDDIN